MSDEAVQNTDREIWRGKSRAEFGDPDKFYADSLFVSQGDVEALGINCGGFVIVKPIREWHALAQQKGEKMPTFEKDLSHPGWIAYMKLNDEVCQILGKALGYPWYKDDQKNFPAATEANGVCVGDHVAESIAQEAANRLGPPAASEERGLREALECAEYALANPSSDQAFALNAVRTALQSVPSSPPPEPGGLICGKPVFHVFCTRTAGHQGDCVCAAKAPPPRTCQEEQD